MAETPDFEQLATRIVNIVEGKVREGFIPNEDDQLLKAVRRDVVEVLIGLVWNARGAVDIAKLDTELSAVMGVTAAGPYVKNLDRALRTLDR